MFSYVHKNAILCLAIFIINCNFFVITRCVKEMRIDDRRIRPDITVMVDWALTINYLSTRCVKAVISFLEA